MRSCEKVFSIFPILKNSRTLTWPQNLADKAYVLEVGRIFLEGKPEDLLDNEDMNKAYLGRRESINGQFALFEI